MTKSDDQRPHVELFTDGACTGNPGPGGWAFILRDRGTGREIEDSDGEASTTNNRMELLGAIRGLERLDGPSRVDLYSDSQYVVKGLAEWMDQWKARGWKRPKNAPVKNLELWKRLDELRAVHQVTARWVRGHSDHPENERCDLLAVAAAERFHSNDGL
ncbi:MAG: ribonuclease HI [Planctomycetes bacterium]|nr:ribonuclease HI [Planctomycetota bacterium]